MDKLEYARKFQVAYRYAIWRRAYTEAEDFAAWYVGFGVGWKPMHWSFADYFRSTYGNTKYEKHRARVEARHVQYNPYDDRDIGRAGIDTDLMRWNCEESIDPYTARNQRTVYTFRTSYTFETEVTPPGSVPGRRRVRKGARRSGLWWRSFINLWPVIDLLQKRRRYGYPTGRNKNQTEPFCNSDKKGP